MPPNIVEPQIDPERQVGEQKLPSPSAPPKAQGSDYLKTFQSVSYFTSHTLIGIVVGVTIIFCFKDGVPLSSTNLHILLCVVGYQFLMAHGILSLAPENSWSSRLKFVNKRRLHWILQIVGSVLGLAGSFVLILVKDIHWNTLHGQFALVAMVFTAVSLVNGLASLYAYEFRRFIPMNLSKLTHICFGTVAFAAASVSLIYGFDKRSFRVWSSDALTSTIIAFTAALTFIIIVNPLVTFAAKSVGAIKNR